MLVCAVYEILKLRRIHHVHEDLSAAVVLFHALDHRESESVTGKFTLKACLVSRIPDPELVADNRPQKNLSSLLFSICILATHIFGEFSIWYQETLGTTVLFSTPDFWVYKKSKPNIQCICLHGIWHSMQSHSTRAILLEYQNMPYMRVPGCSEKVKRYVSHIK